MKDYKKSISIGNSIYPLVSIGTYGRSYEELFELFSCYNYGDLWVDTAYRYGNESIVADALRDSGFPEQKVIYTGKICYSQQAGEYPAINQIVYCPNDNVDLQREKLISFCKSRNIVVQAAMPFGGSEMAKLLTEQDRKRILQQNRKNQIVSVFGTKSAKHMTQNLSYILGE